MRRHELPHLRGHGSGNQVIPGTLILGRTEVQWPMQVFESESHALGWALREEQNCPRHLYRLDVDTGDLVELEIVPAGEATLRPK